MNRRTVHPLYPPSLGALAGEDGETAFRVWAPKAKSVELLLTSPTEKTLPMERGKRGYYELRTGEAAPGCRYYFKLNGNRALPDPVSRHQPMGVHRESEVVPLDFSWSDAGWSGIPLADYIIYELHPGTFSDEGTLDSAIGHLDELVDLGITAVELMPLAQFPGGRNWGYDGVHLFAVQNTYGGPAALLRFVDACHARGLAVILDVVYNHLGPEGNYLQEFGHYFTPRHKTPWGAGINFDGPHSDEVRRFFIENALYWVLDMRIDALRLDAVHAIFDQSARPFLRELADAVRTAGELSGRRIYTIAESNLNDPRMVRGKELGGNGLDGQWVDDLHHSLHVALTGEKGGYYEDFRGTSDLAKSLEQGFVFTGQYSRYRKRRHGDACRDLPAESFVICAQNHDQIGNRMLGERYSQLVSFEQLKLAAGAVLLSPYVPLLFMGEEYGETAPFFFFTSHGDAGLVEAVRQGRKREFADFAWQGEPPDPQAEETYRRCRLDRRLAEQPPGAALRSFYRRLMELRKSRPALRLLSKEHLQVFTIGDGSVLGFWRWTELDEAFAVFNFAGDQQSVPLSMPPGVWEKLIDSADKEWRGPGSSAPLSVESSGALELPLAAHTFLLFSRDRQG